MSPRPELAAPRPGWRTWALVLGVHLLLAWALSGALRPPPGPVAATPTRLQWLRLLPSPTAPAAPSPQAPPSPPPRGAQVAPTRPATPPEAGPTALPSVDAPHRAPSPGTTLAALPEPPASAPVEAPAPAGRLLESAASRAALRALGRQPTLHERSAQAQDQAIARSDQGLSQAVTGAAHGDCLKGEFAGGGAGLLSLPLLAYAAAAGRCSR